MLREDEAMWFQDLYQTYARHLVKLSMRSIGDWETAKDLMQQTFFLLLVKMDTIRGHPNIPGWLFKTNSNLIKRELNSLRRRLEVPLPDWMEISDGNSYHFPLKDLLPRGLTKHQEKILVQFYEENLTYKEIAEQWGITEDHVGVLLYRAKKKLKILYEAEEKRLSRGVRSFQ